MKIGLKPGEKGAMSSVSVAFSHARDFGSRPLRPRGSNLASLPSPHYIPFRVSADCHWATRSIPRLYAALLEIERKI
jgi:hypothetical protein